MSCATSPCREMVQAILPLNSRGKLNPGFGADAKLAVAISKNMTSTARQNENHPHTEQQPELKLSLDQEVLLAYLYEHPQELHSTDSLAASLDDRPRFADEAVAELRAAVRGGTHSPINRKREPEDVERDIEILVFKGLLAGERTGGPAAIRYKGVHLTTVGERRAIALRNPEVTSRPADPQRSSPSKQEEI